MELKKLTPRFYRDHTHLVEALDNIDGAWISDKYRGYGVVLLTYKQLTFAIPLRSNIKHNFCFATLRQSNVKKGLDFTKALLIKDVSYISSEVFYIPNMEYKKINSKSHFIMQKFEQYVLRYITAVTINDFHILSSTAYRFTTLKNYHDELGLK